MPRKTEDHSNLPPDRPPRRNVGSRKSYRGFFRAAPGEHYTDTQPNWITSRWPPEYAQIRCKTGSGKERKESVPY